MKKIIYLILITILITGCTEDIAVKQEEKVAVESVTEEKKVEEEPEEEQVEEVKEEPEEEEVKEEKKETTSKVAVDSMNDNKYDEYLDALYDTGEAILVNSSSFSEEFILDPDQAMEMYIGSIVIIQECIVVDNDGEMLFTEVNGNSGFMISGTFHPDSSKDVNIGDVVTIAGVVSEYEPKYFIAIIDDMMVMESR